MIRQPLHSGRSLIAAALISLMSLSPARAESYWTLPVSTRNRPNLERLAISQDGSLAALACGDATIRIWDLSTGRELRRLVGHRHSPKSMDFSPDKSRLASTAGPSSGTQLRVWSVETGEMLFATSGDDPFRAVRYHPSGRIIIGLGHNDAISIFDATHFTLLGKLWGQYGMDWMSVSPDGRRLCVNKEAYSGLTCLYEGFSADGTQFPDVRTGLRPKRLEGYSYLRFSPDGRFLAGYRRFDYCAVILDSTTFREVRRFKPPGDRKRPVIRVRFSPDGRTLWAHSDGFACQWDIATGEMFRRKKYGEGYSFVLSPDGRFLLHASNFSNLLIWDLERETLIGRLLTLENEDTWLVETTAGYFDYGGQLGAEISDRGRGINGLSVDEHFAKYHKPKIVQRILAGMSAEDAVNLPEDYQPPTVSLDLVEAKAETATLLVKAQTHGEHAKITNVTVTVNGRPLNSIRTKGLTVDAASAGSNQWTTEIEFPPGENTAVITAAAQDSFDQKSEPVSLAVERTVKVAPVPGRLFVLAVGVSEYRKPEYALQYCHADAEALAETLANQKGRAFGDVQVQVYTDKQATVTNVEEGLAWLERSCTPADVAVVLFSGHGIRGERGLYYMTHEANANGIQYTCLNWESVGKALLNTQAKQILFLSDVCHAGAFAESELVPQQELVDSLLESAGIMVFASSRGNELSLERADWQHGAFCKAILEAISGKADGDGDGKVTIGELQSYATARVAELTDDSQHPHLPRLSDFAPDLVLAHVVELR